jgi:RNA polymerase sigma factor (sigma-70 family)
MARQTLCMCGQNWDHLTPAVREELNHAITVLGPLPKPPTREREQALLRIVSDPDRPEDLRLAARDELRTTNLKLVLKAAPVYCGRGLEAGDVINAGVLGLQESIDRWSPRVCDPSGATYRLSSYAAWWIRKAMNDAIHSSRSLFVPNGHVVLQIEALPGYTPVDHRSPETPSIAERVRTALATLRPETALILLARHETPRASWQALARRLGWTVSQVRQAEDLGRSILRVRLQELGETP